MTPRAGAGTTQRQLSTPFGCGVSRNGSSISASSRFSRPWQSRLLVPPRPLPEGRDVIHFIDNYGALAGLTKGYSGDRDSARLVHAFYAINNRLEANVWFAYASRRERTSPICPRGPLPRSAFASSLMCLGRIASGSRVFCRRTHRCRSCTFQPGGRLGSDGRDEWQEAVCAPPVAGGGEGVAA